MSLALDADDASAELGPVAEDLKSEIARLTQTVSGLLTFTRAPENAMFALPSVALGEIMEHVQADWHGPLATNGRRVRLRVPPDLKEAKVPAGLAEQILGVLMDNAASHGSGTVTMGVRDLGGAMAIDVTDEGSQTRPETDLFTEPQPGHRHGIGLPLARSLAQAHGGRLQLSSSDPTTFTWLLVTTSKSAGDNL
jgi:signal transduction histidine kinase